MRAVRKLLNWLAAAHELPYPSSHMHLVEYLQIRHWELCPRGAIKFTHASFVFMEEVSGVTEKLTIVPLYVSLKKELLSASLGSRQLKQALGFAVVVLAALEELIADDARPSYFRTVAW